MTSPLFIDYRDGSSNFLTLDPVASLIDKDAQGHPVSHTLASDALIVGNGPDDSTVIVGVEIKSLHDLLSSINTGRLQATQLPAMLTHDVAWLLYFGAYRSGRDNRLEIRRGKGWDAFKLGSRLVPYGYLESQLLDLAAVGVRVKHVYDEHQAAHWLGALHRWWSKDWKDHKGLRVFDTSRELSLMPGMDAATLQRAKVAAQLPGVGFERAIAAAQHFATVRDMINASSAEWAQVSGIGKVIARAIEGAVT